MTHAQTHIDTQFNNETTEIEVKQVFTNEVVNGKTIIADKLTGELEIKDYPVLTKIELREHEIEKLTVINCPNLKGIRCFDNKLTELDITRIKTDADGNPVPTEKLKSLYIGGNEELKEISLEYCPELETFFPQGNKKLDRILGLSELKLKRINVDELPRDLVDLILTEKGLFPLPREWKSATTFYEQKIDALQEKNRELTEEKEIHLEALKVSEKWSEEKIKRIKELEAEVERLRKLTLQAPVDEIESYKKENEELKNQLAQLQQQNDQLIAQIEVKKQVG